MPGMFFSGFLFISTHILLDLLSLDSAEAHIGWDGNIRTKNYQNSKIGF